MGISLYIYSVKNIFEKIQFSVESIKDLKIGNIGTQLESEIYETRVPSRSPNRALNTLDLQCMTVQLELTRLSWVKINWHLS